MPKSQLCDNLPVSDAEFEAAWTDLSAFEYLNSSYISTAEGLLSALREACTNAAASGVKLCGPFQLDALIDEECEIPPALVETAMTRICEQKGGGWALLPEKATTVVGHWVACEWQGGYALCLVHVEVEGRSAAGV